MPEKKKFTIEVTIENVSLFKGSNPVAKLFTELMYTAENLNLPVKVLDSKSSLVAITHDLTEEISL